jgi:uncharacterized DUF497 family protein
MGIDAVASGQGSFEGLDFVWHPPKAASNLKKHKVSFEEAMTVFGDERHIVFPDRAHSYEENDILPLGSQSKVACLFCVLRNMIPNCA